MTYEFQRSNQLILKLSQMVEELQIKRDRIEKEIMSKIGHQDEPALWKSLTEVRKQIDALHDEKQ